MAVKLINYVDKKIKFVEEEVFYYNARKTNCFAVVKPGSDRPNWTINSWMKCRDAFHNHSHKIDKFLFCHEIRKEKNTAAFIQYIENKLAVTPLSQFGPTHLSDVMWIKPSKWWTHFSMKRSLFTIFLRAGKKFNRTKANIDDIIDSTLYLKNTSYAVYRFLDGYTCYRGNITGWYNQFMYGGINGRKPNDKKVRELLVKP